MRHSAAPLAPGPLAPPRASIVICTVARSGSWLLAEALEATGVCGHPREYFRPDYQDVYSDAWGIEVRRYQDYIDGVLRAGTTADGTFATKLHWGQFVPLMARLRTEAGGTETSDAELMAATFPNLRYVHLTRGDTASQAVSLYKAVHLDVWWSLEGEAAADRGRRLPDEPDWAEVARLEAALRRDDQAWEAYFERAGIRPVRVLYEDLASAYADTTRAVLADLDVPESARTIREPRLSKQADAVSAEWVRRYLAWEARSCEPA